MNQWKETWVAYHKEATRKKIVAHAWHQATSLERVLLVLLTLLFVGSMFMDLRQQGSWLWLALVGETGLISLFLSLKDKMVLNEYGEQDGPGPQLSSLNYQDTRYVLFKKSLNEKGMKTNDLKNCFELVDAQIDIATTETRIIITVIKLSMAVLLGVLAAMWKDTDITDLIFVAASIIAFILLIGVFSAMFPSKAEKLKELKYFMLLYGREQPSQGDCQLNS